MVELDPLNAKIAGRSRKKVLCLTCGGTGNCTPKGPTGHPAWTCSGWPHCDSYVGVHPGSENALGTMAGPDLRRARAAAHSWLDALWRGKGRAARTEVYQLVASVLGVRHFHVAQNDPVLLDSLTKRRADIERAAGRLFGENATPGQSSGTHETTTALIEAVFQTANRRLLPSDQGGKAAAQLCIQSGQVFSSVDGAGRHWIAKKLKFK